ncbi:L-serine ammonia-lyase [Negadavirga shengliensis]|uniref:L-serine dehydratase n=1 Tax=Negadavirga shengliensis TaxID=1389218 RepID=A0ABV9T0N1_9BACT
MNCISVFDMLKIGVGPSSSHTLGPWRAAQRFIREIKAEHIAEIRSLTVELYGSLSLTGKGHATDWAVMLGLSGLDPETIPMDAIETTVNKIKSEKKLYFHQETEIGFDPDRDIIFHKKFLPYHANGLRITIRHHKGNHSATYYSIGGGFVIKEGEESDREDTLKTFPYPIERANQLLEYCNREDKHISDIVWMNELSLRSTEEVRRGLGRIWETMLESMYTGCHSEGVLPGGLKVKRRAFDLHKGLIGDVAYTNPKEWMAAIKKTTVSFRQVLKWVSCFALAVNEVNASFGRIVTAPTNGSAGVIPAVLMYYLTIENHKAGDDQTHRFLLVASEIGAIFKKGATISAAMGGCQAEIGVSSAMAAGALCELLGGSPGQVLIAAEIAMEHHLGMTCDPIAGLVQVPCIERNTMGAIKAINAAELALETDAGHTKVPLDKVVRTMWETARDMNGKYKETSEGGLALTVNWVDC